jgi:hypothetical protein
LRRGIIIIHIFLQCNFKDKRLLFQQGAVSGFAKSIAQKAAETISVALRNFKQGGMIVDKDQEVFGVAVRHRYFSFYHTCTST